MKPKRECPLCGNRNVSKIYSLEFINNTEINGLPNIYDIVLCDNCSLVYDDFDFSQSGFDNYYNNNSSYSQSYHLYYDDNHNKLYIEVFDFISKYLTDKNTQILEFGCGAGELLKLFYNNNYKNLFGNIKAQTQLQINLEWMFLSYRLHTSVVIKLLRESRFQIQSKT